MEATIITLSPIKDGDKGITSVSSATFEEAFGEFSEFRGRGRARRHKRRMERQQNRIARRRARKKSRQDMRSEQQEARQSRKDTRKRRRLSRKEMGNDGSDDDQSQDQGSDDASSQGDDQSQDQGGYDEQSQDEQGSDDQGGYDEQSQDDQGSDDQESDDSGFDGVMGAEDRFSEMNDESKVRVQPAVQDVAKKIEWNKELISRLKQKVIAREANIAAEVNQTTKAQMMREVAEIKAQVNKRIDRVKELEGQLEKYANFEGEFSGADGEFSEFRGGRRGGGGGGRRREVRKAKRAARQERRSLRKENRQERKNPEDGGSETPVENELNPQMSEQRIEVPAEDNSNATGTGLNGLDLVEDYDAPAVRTIELSSNADGAASTKVGKKINWTAVAIGVGVAAVAIWAIKKYKVFEAK